MKSGEFKVELSKTLGRVSAVETVPPDAWALVVIAHGAGAGMKHPFLSGLSAALASQGVASVRFNFSYMEKKKGRPDPPAVACLAVRRAIEAAVKRHPKLPLFAGGKSFGGRMTSTLVSGGFVDRVEGLVFFGFPLHPPGKPSTDRAAHLKSAPVPMLFLQGTRDEFADRDLLHQTVSELPRATLVEFEGANHSFKAGKQNLLPELARRTADWIKTVLAH
jgi:hypothetical protein